MIVDVVTLFLPNSMGNLFILKDTRKGLLTLNIGSFPGQALNPVIGDEIDMRVKFPGNFNQAVRLFV